MSWYRPHLRFTMFDRQRFLALVGKQNISLPTHPADATTLPAPRATSQTRYFVTPVANTSSRVLCLVLALSLSCFLAKSSWSPPPLQVLPPNPKGEERLMRTQQGRKCPGQ